MKKLFQIIALATMCTSGFAQQAYKITGTIENLQDSITLLVEQEPVQTVAVHNGAFAIEGHTVTPLLATLATPGRTIARFILTNDNINIETHPETGIVLTGSSMTDNYNKLKHDLRVLYGVIDERLSQHARAEDWDAYDKAGQDRSEELKRVIKENNDNIVGALLLHENVAMLESQEVLGLIAGFAPEMKSDERLRVLTQNIRTQMALKEGEKCVDITLPDADGKLHSLTDYLAEGKYVILEFWATWCWSCMQKVPKLKSIYDIYKDKGLEIFGVSMDTDPRIWQKIYTERNMNWIQVSNLKEWHKNPVIKDYGIDSIPVILLIAPDGTILFRGQTDVISIEYLLAEIFE